MHVTCRNVLQFSKGQKPLGSTGKPDKLGKWLMLCVLALELNWRVECVMVIHLSVYFCHMQRIWIIVGIRKERKLCPVFQKKCHVTGWCVGAVWWEYTMLKGIFLFNLFLITCGGVMDLWSGGRGFDSRPFYFHVITLCCSHTCAFGLCHQTVCWPKGNDAVQLGRYLLPCIK